MNHRKYNMDEGRSILASLRGLAPARRLRFNEALRIAELQANRLLELTVIESTAVPTEVVSELPRIAVDYRDIPTSGLSYWNDRNWIISVNRFEPLTRQRFTIFHEFKHIIDHGRVGDLYASERQAEQAADFFAGCALVPRTALKRAWGDLVQTPTALAGLFDVSPVAVNVRLAQVGLTESTARCDRPDTTYRPPAPGTYQRQASRPPIHTLANGVLV